MTSGPRRALKGRRLAVVLLLAVTAFAEPKVPKKSKNSPDQLRTDYITRLQQQDVHASSGQTMGSLWSPSSTHRRSLHGLQGSQAE